MIEPSEVAWVVTVPCAPHLTERVEIAAVMADSTGIAEIGEPDAAHRSMIVGFDTRPDAERFAASVRADGLTAKVAPVDHDAWARSETAVVVFGDGSLELEVGTAFGHGGHPTTRLALDGLLRLGPGEGRSLLDVGCGTGVLSLAAARLGWIVSGCDIDPEAVRVATANSAANNLGDRTSFVCASPTDLATPQWLHGSTGFHAAAVNTLVGVHEAQASAIRALLSENGSVIVSGVRGEDQCARVVDAYRASVEAHEVLEGWSLLHLAL